MSEFTSGNLLLANNEAIVRKFAIPESKISKINSDWLVYLTKDLYVESEVPDYIYILSNERPVLYFYNFSDHYWGYSIIHKSEEIAYLHVSLEYEDELLYEIGMERDPVEMRKNFGEIEGLREELEEKNVFEEYYQNIFNDCNVESFRLFEIDNDKIEQLKKILNVAYAPDIDDAMELCEEFKEIIGIEEMSWVNYEKEIE